MHLTLKGLVILFALCSAVFIPIGVVRVVDSLTKPDPRAAFLNECSYINTEYSNRLQPIPDTDAYAAEREQCYAERRAAIRDCAKRHGQPIPEGMDKQ